jgi:hypothetical protein
MKTLLLSITLFTFSFRIVNAQTVNPFLSEIISQYPSVRDVAISANGSEVYFSVQSYQGELSTIIIVNSIDGNYSKPRVANFSGKYHDLEPFLSPDGLRLYFSSDRPLDNKSNELKDYDIWYVERETLKDEWSKAINIGAPINTKDNEFYPSVTLSNNLYFTCDGMMSKGKDDIFMSEYKNGKYEITISLNDSINSVGYEFNAFVSADESFMLYTCYNKEGGFGSGDLYISFKNKANQWTKSQNLGKAINSNAMDYCPFVDMKTGILYFTSKRNFVKKQFDKKQTLEEVLKEMTIYENGLSRLYQMDISHILNSRLVK